VRRQRRLPVPVAAAARVWALLWVAVVLQPLAFVGPAAAPERARGFGHVRSHYSSAYNDRVCRGCLREGLEDDADQAEEPLKLLGTPSGPPPAASGEEVSGLRVPLARVAPRKFKMMFTCKICDHRNTHMISRLAYQQGIVIATCPGCGSRHLISDQTGLLDFGKWDVEQLANSGESVVRLSADGYRQVLAATDKDVAKAIVAEEGAVAAAAEDQRPSEPQLLIKNKDGVIEAVPEEGVSMGSAVEFLSDPEDDAEGEEAPAADR